MKWESKLIMQNGIVRIALIFEENAELIARIKLIEGSRWSQTKSVLHIPDTEENRIRFKIPLHHQTFPSEEGILQIEKFKQWMSSKRYSESTITTYTEALKSFLVFCREKPIVEITNDYINLRRNVS